MLTQFHPKLYLHAVACSSLGVSSWTSRSCSSKSCNAKALPNNEKLELGSSLLGNGTLPLEVERDGSVEGPGALKLSNRRA